MTVAAVPDSVDALKRLWESEKSELERSLRVQQQLRAILLPLQQRCSELGAENERHVAAAEAAAPQRGGDVEAAERGIEELKTRAARAADEIEKQRRAQEASRCLASQRREEASLLSEDLDQLQASLEDLEAALAAHEAAARAMVTSATLSEAEAEATRLQSQLVDQEAEAARLRQALAESWATRGAEPPEAEGPEAQGSEAQGPLEWLRAMQEEGLQEVRKLQQLERDEKALHLRLRQLSEEKAELKSARVDFEDSGSALREAIASQSEGYVRRIDHLELARRSADKDRVKLIQECADLQAQLEAMAPRLRGLAQLEERHAAMEAMQSNLSTQSGRLREMNATLTAQLLAEKGGQEMEKDGVMRTLQLRRKLQERSEVQDAEREKLSGRIRALERGEVAAPAPGALQSATSAFKGGLGRLRDGLKI